MTTWLMLGCLIGGAAVAALWLVTNARGKVAIRQHLAAARERRATETRAMTKGLTHELKNPLSTIGLNADLLREAVSDIALPDDAERAPLLRRTEAIQREAERLTGILQDFEAFAGEIRLHPAATDLNLLVDELVDFYAPQAASAGIRIRADLSGEALIASVDANQLKQALLNLMLNATQAITSSEQTREKELILRTRRSPEGAGADVHVIDTGPGIPDDVRARVFDPYFTTKPSGSGIGLTITRRIVEEHRGTLTVHSEPDRGTDFRISLPLAGEA
jgi:signal transduction histidine kinase